MEKSVRLSPAKVRDAGACAACGSGFGLDDDGQMTFESEEVFVIHGGVGLFRLCRECLKDLAILTIQLL